MKSPGADAARLTKNVSSMPARSIKTATPSVGKHLVRDASRDSIHAAESSKLKAPSLKESTGG